jgi:hypothetical protein
VDLMAPIQGTPAQLSIEWLSRYHFIKVLETIMKEFSSLERALRRLPEGTVLQLFMFLRIIRIMAHLKV